MQRLLISLRTEREGGWGDLDLSLQWRCACAPPPPFCKNEFDQAEEARGKAHAKQGCSRGSRLQTPSGDGRAGARRREREREREK